MILVHLLLILCVLVALILQLITPLVLNIPLVAFVLAALVFSLWQFKRARNKGNFPVVASVALGLQSVLFLLSLAILFIVTVPHESAGDSHGVVQGLRRLITGEATPEVAQTPVGNKAAETVNAPDEKKIQITVDGDEPAKVPEEKKPEP